MSYSFSVVKPTTEEAKAEVEAKMAEIAKTQTEHSFDRDAVCTVVDLYLEMLDERAEGAVHVSVSGSLGWNEHGPEGARMRMFTGAGINVSVRKVPS